MKLVSLQEVLEATGIRYATLVKYRTLGLVPDAVRRWGGHKGSASFYHPGVIERIKNVQHMKAEGMRLSYIAYLHREGEMQ